MTGSLQQKNGKYYAVINLKENGKRKQKWIDTGLTIKGNKIKAEKFLREQLSHLEEIEGVIRTDVLFGDYLSHWLKSTSSKIEVTTYQSYSEMVYPHLIPYFNENGIKLCDITRKDIQGYIDYKAKCGRKDGKGGLSASTLRRHRVIMHMALDLAIREGYIKHNPCELIDLPKSKKYEPKYSNREEVSQILKALKGEAIFPIIYVIATYGLRKSEALGLRWRSIDLIGGTMTINNTVVKHATITTKERTKNESSYRTLPLNDDIKELFISIKAKQEENRKFFGKGYTDSDYVFTWDDGRQFRPDYVYHAFSNFLESNGFRHITIHGLRHTCASILLSEGFNLKDVQETLGHSNIALTANTYGHLDMTRKKAVANQMSFDIGEC